MVGYGNAEVKRRCFAASRGKRSLLSPGSESSDRSAQGANNTGCPGQRPRWKQAELARDRGPFCMGADPHGCPFLFSEPGGASGPVCGCRQLSGARHPHGRESRRHRDVSAHTPAVATDDEHFSQDFKRQRRFDPTVFTIVRNTCSRSSESAGSHKRIALRQGRGKTQLFSAGRGSYELSSRSCPCNPGNQAWASFACSIFRI
jgi:hypothetical protein